MKLGNGKAGFRVWFSEEELNQITDGGATQSFSAQFNPNSQDHFIVFSQKDLPNGLRVMLSKSGSGSKTGDQFFLTSNSSRFKPFMSKLPLFGSELGILRKTEDNGGAVWHVVRPKMDIPQQARPERSPKPKKAFGHEKLKEKPVTTALTEPAAQTLPKPVAGEQKLLNTVASFNNMEAAISILNKLKAEKGDSMIMEITQAGRLKVLLEYGG